MRLATRRTFLLTLPAGLVTGVAIFWSLRETQLFPVQTFLSVLKDYEIYASSIGRTYLQCVPEEANFEFIRSQTLAIRPAGMPNAEQVGRMPRRQDLLRLRHGRNCGGGWLVSSLAPRRDSAPWPRFKVAGDVP